MPSTSRLFLAALALISTVSFVRAQDGAAPKPAPLAASGTPQTALSALPAIPFADGRASAAKPALTIDKSALTIEPVAPPAPAKAEPSAAQKSSVDVSSSFNTPASAASVATVDTATNPAPPNAAANTALAKSVETEFPTKTGTRGWILLGLVAVALFASISRYSRRIPSSIKPAANRSPEPVAVRVPARLN